jgi:hypothetical protein
LSPQANDAKSKAGTCSQKKSITFTSKNTLALSKLDCIEQLILMPEVVIIYQTPDFTSFTG